ncbi:MAG: type VI secretion system tip protein TssI/VgrG [Polyangiaceae bacterium]
MSTSSSRDVARLHVEGLAPLRVRRALVRERLSEAYRVTATVTLEDGVERALVGRPATLVIRVDDARERCVQGLVTRASHRGDGARGATLELRVEPRVARLRLRSGRRIFQNKTAAEIALEVLAEHGVHARMEIARALDARPYTVQLDESDAAFVQRLLAEEGVSYMFEQPRETVHDATEAPAEVIVLTDRPTSRRGSDTPHLVHRQGASSDARGADELYDVRYAVRQAIERVAIAGLDFQRPSTSLTDDAADPGSGLAGPAPLERVVHELAYETVPAKPGPARVELDARRRDVALLRGRASARDLVAGTRFALVESLEPELAGDWAIVESTLRVDDARAIVCETRLTSVRADRPYPPVRLPKPVCHGVETATVLGPAGEEVHTDRHGRVRVRFPWDRSTTAPDRVSTWLRVAQAWAGVGFGAQFLPRVGSEVLVAFVGGDPDRPIVVGGLYDVHRPYPYPLPASKTESGIRTRSIGGAGASELLFEDRAGLEVLTLRGARNVFVGAGANLVEQVTADVERRAGGAYARHVAGGLVESVGGARAVTVVGPHTEQTGGAAILRGGDQSVAVRGGRLETCGESMEVRVGRNHELLIGTKAPGHAAVTVQGTHTTTASGRISIRSQTEIALQVGGTSLVLREEGITLVSPSVRVESPDIRLVGKDGEATLSVTDSVRARADAVELLGKGANLLLGERARLEGDAIELTSKAAKEDAEPLSSSSESGVVTFEIQGLEAGKAATAVVLMPSGDLVEHPVPPSGILEIPGQPGERFHLVDVRVAGASVAKA